MVKYNPQLNHLMSYSSSLACDRSLGQVEGCYTGQILTIALTRVSDKSSWMLWSAFRTPLSALECRLTSPAVYSVALHGVDRNGPARKLTSSSKSYMFQVIIQSVAFRKCDHILSSLLGYHNPMICLSSCSRRKASLSAVPLSLYLR